MMTAEPVQHKRQSLASNVALEDRFEEIKTRLQG
jgi:hypothetical protein